MGLHAEHLTERSGEAGKKEPADRMNTEQRIVCREAKNVRRKKRTDDAEPTTAIEKKKNKRMRRNY